MLSFPNAKINIGLNITEKRNDGFHNIYSIFYPIEWCDALEIVPTQKTTSFESKGIAIPGKTQDNLCTKVSNSFNEKYNTENHLIYLQKNIPIGAGLGGGSADAAFAAKLINDIHQLNLNDSELEEIVKPLGSDCAFFIKNKPTLAINKGDEFIPLDISLKDNYIVLIYPNLHISTKEAYAGISPQKPIFDLSTINQIEKKEWVKYIYNDFENSLFPKYPILKDIKTKLYQNGAFYASMTGSGSTIFGLYEHPPQNLEDFKHFQLHTHKLKY